MMTIPVLLERTCNMAPLSLILQVLLFPRIEWIGGLSKVKEIGPVMRQFLPPLRGNQLWQVITKDIMDYLSWRHPLLESLHPSLVIAIVPFPFH
jgi:hypothetical protein